MANVFQENNSRGVKRLVTLVTFLKRRNQEGSTSRP